MSDIKEVKMPEGYEGHKVKCQQFSLYDSHVEVKLPSGMTKAISVGDFITTLAKTLNQEMSIKTTLLPANCYIWGQTLTEMRLSCYYPGKMRKVMFLDKANGDPKTNTKELAIPFPNIVVSHTLRRKADSWEHIDARYFATSRPVSQLGNDFIFNIDHKNQIWALPLGNSYADGKICYGHNTILRGPFRESFRGLDWHFVMLYNSSFNNDLTIPSIVNPKGWNCGTWYQELTKHTTFPYELLVNGVKIGYGTQSEAQQIAADGVAAMDAPPQTVTPVITPARPARPIPNLFMDTPAQTPPPVAQGAAGGVAQFLAGTGGMGGAPAGVAAAPTVQEVIAAATAMNMTPDQQRILDEVAQRHADRGI